MHRARASGLDTPAVTVTYNGQPQAVGQGSNWKNSLAWMTKWIHVIDRLSVSFAIAMHTIRTFADTGQRFAIFLSSGKVDFTGQQLWP
jgi:hypothetical protein